MCTVFIIIFVVPSLRFSIQPSPILLHSSLLYSLKELDFETVTLLCIWNGGSTENSVLIKSKKSIKLAIPADSYIGWCRRRVEHKSQVSVTRLKCQSQSHRSHICLWPVECVDNLPLSLIYIFSLLRPISYVCTAEYYSKYCYRKISWSTSQQRGKLMLLFSEVWGRASKTNACLL